MYKNKTVILGISGSIAAYKMADVASSLTKMGINVETIMTLNATKIIDPIVFSTLTSNKTLVDTFDKNVNYNVAHVSLANKCDLLMVAPATANVIAKLAHGIADDMLTTTALACHTKKYISPAMNTNMYENPIVQDNLEILKSYGWKIITPDTGILACKDTGIGKLPKPEILTEHILEALTEPKDLIGKRVLITAGPTRESIDPVRFITNHSSGKMGYALAKAAMRRGADVTLVSGPVNLEVPINVNLINVTSAQDMYDAVLKESDSMDIIIKAAAVADFTPETEAEEKIKKKDGLNIIKLDSTKDILKELGKRKHPGQIICGFSMETQNLEENSQKKLHSKNADLICANSLKTEGAGFNTDTNVITLIGKKGIKKLQKTSKLEAANLILDEIISNKIISKNNN